MNKVCELSKERADYLMTRRNFEKSTFFVLKLLLISVNKSNVSEYFIGNAYFLFPSTLEY